MSGLDQDISNLERFNALLATTIEHLRQGRSDADSREHVLEGLADQGGQQWDSLERDLEGHRSALEAAEGEAAGALERLETEAAAGHQTRLAQAEQHTGQLAGALQQALDHAEAELQKSASELATGGFEASSTTTSGLESQAGQEQADLESAFDDADHGLEAVRQDVDEMAHGLQAALAELASETGSQDDEVRAVSELVDYVNSTFVGAVDACVEACESALAGVYEAWTGQADEGAHALTSEVSALLGDTTEHLESEAGRPLADDVDGVDRSTAELLSALSRVEATLGAGLPIAEATAPLVPELAIADRVVTEVDQLLESIQT